MNSKIQEKITPRANLFDYETCSHRFVKGIVTGNVYMRTTRGWVVVHLGINNSIHVMYECCPTHFVDGVPFKGSITLVD